MKAAHGFNHVILGANVFVDVRDGVAEIVAVIAMRAMKIAIAMTVQTMRATQIQAGAGKEDAGPGGGPTATSNVPRSWIVRSSADGNLHWE